MKSSTWDAPHVVYKCYDADGVLIYVGFTVDFRRRWSQHRTHFPELVVNTARVVQETYPNRRAAAEGESRCIDAGVPVFNQRRGWAYTPSMDELRAAMGLGPLPADVVGREIA